MLSSQHAGRCRDAVASGAVAWADQMAVMSPRALPRNRTLPARSPKSPARQVERSSRKIRFVAGRATAERFTISLNLLNNPIWKWQRSHNPSGPALKISHQILQTGSDDATALVGSQAGTIVASQLSSK
jgi:hypothetical protein